MTHKLFEEKHHASIYHKYRLDPPDEVKELILQYLDEKKELPHELAVDLGCGTGQMTRLLSPHFQKVVGIDVSESQLGEARAVAGFSNLTYRTGPWTTHVVLGGTMLVTPAIEPNEQGLLAVSAFCCFPQVIRSGTAEELPFPGGSVDLMTASCAAHWFDPERFLKEAARVLKPRGCLALVGYTDQFGLNYGSCGDRLDDICTEVRRALLPYTSTQVAVSNSKLQGLYEAIPFPDKERIENIAVKLRLSVKGVVGLLVESTSMYQTYLKAEPHAAANLLQATTSRLLEEMGVSSPDTQLDFTVRYYCVLACRPQ